MSQNIIILSFLAALALIFYTSFAYLFNQLLAGFFYTSFLSCITWLLVFLIEFVIKLTSVNSENPFICKYLKVLKVVCALDCISLLLNVVFGHVVELRAICYENGSFFCWLLYPKSWYKVSLTLHYFLVCNFVFFIIFRIARFPHDYQRKFYHILVVFFGTVIVNALFMIFHWTYNFSILLYSIVAFQLFYYSYYSIPKDFSGILMEQALSSINAAVVCYDISGKCIFINALAKKIFMIKESPKKYFLAESYFMRWKRQYPDLGDNPIQEDDYFAIDGEIHTFESELRQLKDKKNRTIGYFIKLEDKTGEIQIYEQEKFLATHDKLTGLLNREAFFEKVRDVILKSPEVSRYLVCSDIQNFKLINDLFGEEMGNEVLIAQARFFERADYPDMVLGRIGGDKYAMLIEKKYFKKELAEKNTKLVENILYDKYHYRFRIYLGVYEIADVNEDIQSMCDKATMALKKIVGDFTKVLNFYDISIMQELIKERSILNEFPEALAKGQFCIYIQPQFTAREEKVLGGEALVRWNHPVNGMMSPNEFVHTLETTDYISNLDNYIWEEAAKTLSEWKKQGKDQFYLSVNISAKDFYYLDIYGIFTNLVEKYDINPKNLNLEVTETVLMYNVTMHQEVLNKLRAFGFAIEMDDFGSGYSSLSTLRNLSMDVLKIDMEFLRSTENYDQSLKIIGSIIEMAKSLKMTVITEGVELEHQANALKKLGCDVFQGYYFSRPVAADVFEKLYVFTDKKTNAGKHKKEVIK